MGVSQTSSEFGFLRSFRDVVFIPNTWYSPRTRRRNNRDHTCDCVHERTFGGQDSRDFFSAEALATPAAQEWPRAKINDVRPRLLRIYSPRVAKSLQNQRFQTEALVNLFTKGGLDVTTYNHNLFYHGCWQRCKFRREELRTKPLQGNGSCPMGSGRTPPGQTTTRRGHSMSGRSHRSCPMGSGGIPHGATNDTKTQ